MQQIYLLDIDDNVIVALVELDGSYHLGLGRDDEEALNNMNFGKGLHRTYAEFNNFSNFVPLVHHEISTPLTIESFFNTFDDLPLNAKYAYLGSWFPLSHGYIGENVWQSVTGLLKLVGIKPKDWYSWSSIFDDFQNLEVNLLIDKRHNLDDIQGTPVDIGLPIYDYDDSYIMGICEYEYKPIVSNFYDKLVSVLGDYHFFQHMNITQARGKKVVVNYTLRVCQGFNLSQLDKESIKVLRKEWKALKNFKFKR